MFHSPGDKGNKALGDNVLLFFQPKLYFSAQITGILRIAAEKAKDFVEIMRMSLKDCVRGFIIPGADYQKRAFQFP